MFGRTIFTARATRPAPTTTVRQAIEAAKPQTDVRLTFVLPKSGLVLCFRSGKRP